MNTYPFEEIAKQKENVQLIAEALKDNKELIIPLEKSWVHKIAFNSHSEVAELDALVEKESAEHYKFINSNRQNISKKFTRFFLDSYDSNAEKELEQEYQRALKEMKERHARELKELEVVYTVM